MSIKPHRRAVIQLFIQATLPAIEALPPDARMDAYLGMAEACKGKLPEARKAALKAAAALREVNQSQLLLRALLKTK